jgi:thiol-disulfide isomerase/thioredoxin
VKGKTSNANYLFRICLLQNGHNVFCDHCAMSLSSPVLPEPVLVVCLCAQWCGVCNEYRPRFEQLKARFTQATLLWIDVEDEADLLHPLDVENFPTLLIAVGDAPRFFGPMTPQIEVLERLIGAQIDDGSGARALADPDLLEVLARIRSAKSV